LRRAAARCSSCPLTRPTSHPSSRRSPSSRPSCAAWVRARARR
jgi:hypothetical protein